jgi:hypothetical protein
MSLYVSRIRIHPVKSLGGFETQAARLTDRGLEHDRRWMLVDAQGGFVTQRELPAMACLHTAPAGDGFSVTDTRDGAVLELPWLLHGEALATATVWSDRLHAVEAPAPWSRWFVQRLGLPLRLVHMPDRTHRRTDGRYAASLNSLSDAFPYLIAAQASLDDLNARLPAPVPMDRFRPNVVIGGGAAWQEDAWDELSIGAARFKAVKPCARCAIVGTDQRTGERSDEPLRTLAAFRKRHGKVLFGVNAVALAGELVRVGDPVEALA